MTSLEPSTNHACEIIDAAIFSGDEFYENPKALEELEAYVKRWQRAIIETKEQPASVPSCWNCCSDQIEQSPEGSFCRKCGCTQDNKS